MFDKIQEILQRFLGPLATKLNQSELVSALTNGVMGTMPITLGVSLLSVLLYLPVEPWQAFLTSAGLLDVGMQALSVTQSMLTPYILVSVAIAYANVKKISVVNSAMLALGVYFILMPMNAEVGEYQTTYSLTMDFLGSTGMFPALIIGLGIPALYEKLLPKMGIKLPDTVPSMVTDSLAPTFVAMITFICAFLVKWGFSLTPFGSFYAFFNGVIAAPIMSFGASPAALIFVYTFSNLLWFFGIHPAAILNVYAPAMITASMGNIQAFMAGTPSAELPYLPFSIIYSNLTIGGSGIMIGLALAMLTAKSDRYKSLSKVSFVPSLVNISEPMVFGTPVVLNPLFFFPLVLSVPVVGGVSWLLCNLGLANGFNPLIALPWIMPWPITALMQGGLGFCAITLVSTAISFALYFPFFKVADSMALKEEQEALQKADA